MAIHLHHYQAASQHQFHRDVALRVGGRDVTPQQLRAHLRPASPAQPLVEVSTALPQATRDANISQVDATTRLRALLLAASTGVPVALAAPVAQRSEVARVVMAAVGPIAQAAQLNLANAVLVSREWETSTVTLAVDLTLSGRRLVGELQVRQARSHHQEARLDAARVHTLLDPLVLNFNGPLTLAAGAMWFDLNADGLRDRVPRVASDSYLLARDSNGNGQIDDGAEVIGALSGNGYAELRALDENQDGFLTGADAAFRSLRLWRPGDAGVGTELDARKVAAIYLVGIDSPFDLADVSGTQRGRVRQSAFFIADTQLHLSQQVDFLV